MAAGEMALLLSNCLPPSNATSLFSPSTLFPLSAAQPSCLPLSSIGRKPTPFVGYRIQAPFVLVKQNRCALIVKTSADADASGLDASQPPSESKEQNVPFQNLPLESTLQLKLEQKMRMKLAKKIRLRRKRLVRKRHLRKKGRWPPSKLKKNKNV